MKAGERPHTFRRLSSFLGRLLMAICPYLGTPDISCVLAVVKCRRGAFLPPTKRMYYQTTINNSVNPYLAFFSPNVQAHHWRC